MNKTVALVSFCLGVATGVAVTQEIDDYNISKRLSDARARCNAVNAHLGFALNNQLACLGTMNIPVKPGPKV